MDGYARTLVVMLDVSGIRQTQKIYISSTAFVCLSSVLVVSVFMKSFTLFIDLVGVLVFVLGPIYALLNHRAMFGPDMLLSSQPSRFMKLWSILGVLVMSAVAIGYIWLRWLA